MPQNSLIKDETTANERPNIASPTKLQEQHYQKAHRYSYSSSQKCINFSRKFSKK